MVFALFLSNCKDTIFFKNKLFFLIKYTIKFNNHLIPSKSNEFFFNKPNILRIFAICNYDFNPSPPLGESVYVEKVVNNAAVDVGTDSLGSEH